MKSFSDILGDVVWLLREGAKFKDAVRVAFRDGEVPEFLEGSMTRRLGIALGLRSGASRRPRKKQPA